MTNMGKRFGKRLSNSFCPLWKSHLKLELTLGFQWCRYINKGYKIVGPERHNPLLQEQRLVPGSPGGFNLGLAVGLRTHSRRELLLQEQQLVPGSPGGLSLCLVWV